MDIHYQIGQNLDINLSLTALPYYALRSVLRMVLALSISLIFSLSIGYVSAKNKKAEAVLIPLIDILQSVPILGFLSLSVIGFIWLFPNSLLGPECAAIFVIFTSQAWNMTLSIYQSIKLLPSDYEDVGSALNLNAWQKFWRIELPYATPALLWNMMISLSGGWFFVVASEAIAVNNQNILLPGIGSYINTAIAQTNISAIIFAIMTMLIVIFIYDQLVFRPLLKVATQFQDLNDTEDDLNEINNSTKKSQQYNSWVYDILQRTKLMKKVLTLKDYLVETWVNKLALIYNNLYNHIFKSDKPITEPKASKNIYWFEILLLTILSLVLFVLFDFINNYLTFKEIIYVFYIGLLTALKIFILVAICSIIWLPIGVYIGNRQYLSKYLQPIIQFLAAFPANLIYPILVILIIKYKLNPEIWTAPLLIIGTQWYILFNIIAGINNIPKDLKDVVKNYGVKNLLWWRKFMLPAIFPYYITGAMTAAGGAWNASILAETISWGHTTITATGLGSYITEATKAGDFARIALGITIMSLYVTILNKLLWQRLYNLAASRYQMSS
ncbi:MAG: ABC transporter permease subunit [Gammaproteobacteria bacterium]|nr:ABC transporter permease subunit [Gammaproteobacteria bacterium]